MNVRVRSYRICWGGLTISCEVFVPRIPVEVVGVDIISTYSTWKGLQQNQQLLTRVTHAEKMVTQVVNFGGYVDEMLDFLRVTSPPAHFKYIPRIVRIKPPRCGNELIGIQKYKDYTTTLQA